MRNYERTMTGRESGWRRCLYPQQLERDRDNCRDAFPVSPLVVKSPVKDRNVGGGQRRARQRVLVDDDDDDDDERSLFEQSIDLCSGQVITKASATSTPGAG